MDIPNLTTEIESIVDSDTKLLTKEVFKRVPPYFWTLPASSSGKYHPPRERAAYGLVYHTKEVFRFGLIIADSCNTVPLDRIKSAVLLHDVGRYGLEKAHSPYSLNNHPDIAADLVMQVGREVLLVGLQSVTLYTVIADAVRRHMGRWSRNEKPQTTLDWIVHLADNVASKNWYDEKE